MTTDLEQRFDNLRAVLIEDVNHYTLSTSERGAKATAAEIRAGDNPNGGFVPFSESQQVGERTTFELAGGASYRYYVIWITDPNTRAHVNEVRAG